MFDTTFTYTSSTPLPPTLPIDTALETLRDFDTVIRLSPDCRGCKPIPPPKGGPVKANGAPVNGVTGDTPENVQYYEVEDDLPFVPKRMWSGGVKYQADFLPVDDGCDITVHAPGGFTSTNHWRILREVITEGGIREVKPVLDQGVSKDLHHAENAGAGWYVQIVSDARCPRAFAGIVKGFLKNSHDQLQRSFIERLAAAPPKRSRRPTLGRRRSSVF